MLGARREDGASGLEYVALLLLVALVVVVLALSGNSPRTADAVHLALCRIFSIFEDEECIPVADGPGEPDDAELEEDNRLGIPCLAGRDSLGLDGMVLIPIPKTPLGAQLEGAVGYRIDQIGTGTFRVTFFTAEGAGIGQMSGPYIGDTRAGQVGRYYAWSATEGFRALASYDFDSYDEASSFANNPTQWLRASPVVAVDTVLGGPGGLIQAGINGVLDSMWGPAPPEAFTYASGYLRAEADLGYYGGARLPGAGGGLAFEGDWFLSDIHLEGPVNGWSFFTVEGTAEGNLQFITQLAGPAAGVVGVGGGVTTRYRVFWDEQGNPVRLGLILETTTEGQFGFGRGGPGPRGGSGDTVGQNYTHIVVTEHYLDLRNQDNRDAFDRVFWNVPGKFAVPSLPPSTDAMDELAERFAEDGIEIVLEYDEQTLAAAGLGGGAVNAGGRAGVQVLQRDLVSATYVDQAWENPTPQTFVACYTDFGAGLAAGESGP